MAAAAGIFNHAMTAGQALTGRTASPMDTSASGTSGSGSSGDSGGDSATISANDFLTLLVTEMQNQDPTATTDPNEYINQLVQVNSLEQLININQTLTTDLGAPATPTGQAATQAAGAASSPAGPTPTDSSPAAAEAHGGARSPLGAAAATSSSLTGAAAASQAIRRAPGNLGVPSASAASQRVAHALGVRTHSKPIAGRLAAFERTSQNREP